MAVNVPAIAHKPPPLASQACRDRQLFEEWVVRLVSVLFRKTARRDGWMRAAGVCRGTGRGDGRRGWASQKRVGKPASMKKKDATV